MPWSNQGGGPWGAPGGGSKGPWGSGPQSSGPTPPDLEELLRRSQDKLKSVLPGGNLGGRGVLLIVLAAVLVWGFSGFFRLSRTNSASCCASASTSATPSPASISPALSGRDRAHPEGHARQPHRHRHAR